MAKPLKVAINIAKEAGGLMLATFDSKKTNGIHYKKHGEVVTDLDRRINSLAIEQIQKAFPDHDIITEEADEIDSGSTTSKWYVDPIDGTNNFVHHIPNFCISIAHEEAGKLSAGVVFDPLHNEMFTAEAGKGAKLNGKKIRVSDRAKLSDSLISIDRGRTATDQREQNQVLRKFLQKLIRHRNLGTAAIELAYVAAGRLDAVFLTGAKAWDNAAGVLLVREAGGKATNYKNKPWQPIDRNCLASNGKLHRKLL